MDIKILENLFQVTIDRWNLSNRHHQVIQKRIMINLSLLKSGKVELRITIDQGNFRKFLGIHCKKLNLIVRNFYSSRRKCAFCKVRRADSQQESGEERVTAKLRPMMNLTARMLSVVSSSIFKPGEGLVWTSRSWKICSKWRSIGENLRDRHHQVIQKRITVNFGFLKSGNVELRITIDLGHQRKFLGIHCKKLIFIVRNLFSTEMRIPQGAERWFTMDRENLRQWITKNKFLPKISSWTVTQQNLCNKVKDQCERQKRMSNVAETGDEQLIMWGMFMATTLNATTFMGKNFSIVQSAVKNSEDLTLKQMFDVTAQLVNNQDEINGLDKILCGKWILGHVCH